MAKKPITITMQKEDAANLKVIMQDQKIEKGTSEALRICVEDAFHLKPDFKKDLEKAKSFNNANVIIDEEVDLKSKSFLVEEEIFQEVYNWIKENMGLHKPRISFVVKACLVSARVRFEEQNLQKNIIVEEEPNEELPSMGATMMMVGRLYENQSDVAKDKLKRIVEILMEG